MTTSDAPKPVTDHPAPAEPVTTAESETVPESELLPPTVEAAAKRRLPVRTMLRWTAATVLCLGLGTGTAFAVMAPKRTDLPGLQTPDDGRYAYPALRLPELPPGAAGPSAGGAAQGVPGGSLPHAIGDVRLLLLPSALGGRPDPALPGRKGWVAMADYAKLFTMTGAEAQLLRENGARQVAATGWTMPDGTHVAIYLVPFRSEAAASTVAQVEYGDQHLAQAPGAGFNTAEASLLPGVAQDMSSPARDGKPAVRASVFSSKEIAGLLVLTNPKAVNPVDFEQALTLQNELLGG
jgi:hypothetical protein